MAFGGITGKATTNWTNEEILSTTTAQSLGLSAGATPDAAFGALNTKIGGAITSQLLYEDNFVIEKDGDSWSNTFGNDKQINYDYNTLGFIFITDVVLTVTFSGRGSGNMGLRIELTGSDSDTNTNNIFEFSINESFTLSHTFKTPLILWMDNIDNFITSKIPIVINNSIQIDPNTTISVSSPFSFNYQSWARSNSDNSRANITNSNIHYRVYALKTNF